MKATQTHFGIDMRPAVPHQENGEPALPRAEFRRPARLLIWHWGRRGGGPRFTYELVRELCEREDIELHLSVSRQSEIFETFRALNVREFFVDTYSGIPSAVMQSLYLPRLRRTFRAYLVNNDIDIVICTMTHVWNSLVVDVIEKAGAIFVLFVHDANLHPGEYHRLRDWLRLRELRAADHLITFTKSVRDTLARQLGYPKERVSVVPLGVFSSGSHDRLPRDLPTDRPVRLLFFGRILPYKGLDLLLEALPLIRRQLPNVELYIVGSGDLKPYRHLMRGLEGLHVDNRWVPETEISEVLASHDLVVLPYREASQSGVVAVAFGEGIPVVATPAGGLPEQVADLNTGLVSAETSARALGAAIVMLLTDPVLYRRCSESALRHSRDTLGWPRIADLVMKTLNDVKARLGATRGAPRSST